LWLKFVPFGLGQIAAEARTRIAMAQVHCISSDRAGNLQRVRHALEDAKKADVQLVCFPETMLYGWVNPDAHKMASGIPGKDVNAVREMAREFSLHVCIGLCEKDGGALYDSAVLIGADGAVLLKHRKINVLTELMDPPYTAGRGVRVVETEFGVVGLMICADSFAEGVLAEMKKLKPDLLLIPYGWANRGEQWPEHGESLKSTIARAAKEIGCPVIGTNSVGSIAHGPWKGMVFGGQSYAVSSDGSVLAKGRDRDRDIVIVNLDR